MKFFCFISIIALFISIFFANWLFSNEERIGRKSIVLGVGECCVDLFAQTSDALIERHAPGHKGGGFFCDPGAIDQIVKEIEEPIKIIPGGSAANTIRALARLGANCAFAGSLGTDRWGEVFRENLRQLAVGAHLGNSPFTTRVLCLISPDGQRTFIVEDAQDMGRLLPEIDLENVKWIHLEARSLNRDLGSVEKIVAEARRNGIPFSLDLSDFEIVEQYKEILLRLVDRAKIVFGNEDEIRALTGLAPEESCLILQKHCPICVATLGERGCLVGSIGSVEAVAAFPSQAIDPTGAGDHFAAGFLYGYFQNWTLKECALFGNRLGGAIVEVIGTELPEKFGQPRS